MPLARAIAVACALVAAACAFGRGAVAQDAAPKELPAADRDLQAAVNAAVERGVARLEASQGPDGAWRGEFGRAGSTALALYTLLCSGVPKAAPAAARAAAWLEGLGVAEGTTMDVMADQPAAVRMTYDHALLVLALLAHDPEAHRKTVRRSVQTLVSEQLPSGQWAYSVTMGGPLDRGDNSNTQFALLALRQAAKAGFPVPKSVWQRSLRHFEATVGEDGGWGYGCPGTMEGSYGSMTAVGVASLVLCKAMLLGEPAASKFRYREVPAIASGLRWLASRFAADRNPRIDAVEMAAPQGAPQGPPGMPQGGPGRGAGPQPSERTFLYYWLYAVERVGMLLQERRMGAHAWYREGAEWLVARQGPDGGWANPDSSMGAPEPPLVATCFALLFLRRATPPVVTVPEGDAR